MKKFSTSNGIKVNDAPKNDIKQASNDIRNTIMSLIDNSLRITTYGSARKEVQPSTTKITGKEMLVEAILNLIKDKESLNAIKSLEMLKENVTDWVSIDENIDGIRKHQSCYSFLNDNFDHVKGILKLMERMTIDNIEPLMETVYDKYDEKALDFNNSLVTNMIQTNDYDVVKLTKIQQYIQSKRK